MRRECSRIDLLADLPPIQTPYQALGLTIRSPVLLPA
jgi:hypothetical protein